MPERINGSQAPIWKLVVERSIVGIDVWDAQAATFLLGLAHGTVANPLELYGLTVRLDAQWTDVTYCLPPPLQRSR